MREVIYGENASGKTRYCTERAKYYKSQNLKVITNILSLNNSYANHIPDLEKRQALIEYFDEAKDYYNGITTNYSEDIGYIFDLVTAQGDVLIIDDMDSTVPEYVFERIVNLLREDAVLGSLWKDVLISGYSKSNINLMDDLVLSGITFVKENTITKINTWEAFEDEYYDTRCGKEGANL